MNRIEKFLAKPIKFSIDDEEFEIMPMAVGDLDKYSGLMNASEKEQNRAMLLLLRETLKKLFPGANDEQIDHIRVDFALKVSEKIAEVNNFNISESGRKKVAEERDSGWRQRHRPVSTDRALSGPYEEAGCPFPTGIG